MGLFSRLRQALDTGTAVTAAQRANVDQAKGIPGLVVVRYLEGPVPGTRDLIARYRSEGIAHLTVVFDYSEVDTIDEELAELIELDMHSLLEQHGYPSDHVTFIL